MEESFPFTAHLVGACGTGMKALAEVLLDCGWNLSGSDLSSLPEPMKHLVDRGFVFYRGHQASNLSVSTRHLVFSAAVPASNAERLAAVDRGIPQCSYSQMVARLTQRLVPGLTTRQTAATVCVAGTHGKSTTTAMTASILDRAHRLAMAFVGAEDCRRGRNGWTGDGDLSVVESCEFRQSFFDFAPKYAAILNVEHDHFDCYPDLASLVAAFAEFARRIPADGMLLVNADCPIAAGLATFEGSRPRRVTFGWSESADWRATEIQPSLVGTRFQVTRDGRPWGEISLSLSGTHNVLNGLAAAALCAEIGVDSATIQQSLHEFRGIRRRLESVGDYQQRSIYDDYAHHPTAVAATLKALRERVGRRRIVCLFQPHQVQRTERLMEEFAGSFSHADEVWIAPIYAARELNSSAPSSIAQQLVQRILDRGGRARHCSSLDQMVSTLEDASRRGDVILTMGAGDIDWVYHEFIRRIQRDSSA